MDKQANRRARFAPGANLHHGRLNGSQGVTNFLKLTVRGTYGFWSFFRLVPSFLGFDVGIVIPSPLMHYLLEFPCINQNTIQISVADSRASQPDTGPPHLVAFAVLYLPKPIAKTQLMSLDRTDLPARQ